MFKENLLFDNRARLSEVLDERISPAKKRISVSVGESVRILRELQELSQNQLSALTGVPQAALSAIENDRFRLGVERAKVLSRAMNPPRSKLRGIMRLG